MFDWFEQNKEIFFWVTIASAIFFVASIVAVGIVLVRIPADHFEKPREKTGSLALRVGRNILGWLLILAGLAMLVLPGQGMLVLLIGVMLADFPGKHRLQRWIISRKKILATINKLRAKFGREPLKVSKDHRDSHASTPTPKPA